MPRRARIALAGIALHLIQQGNNREGYGVVVDFLEKCQMEHSARVICSPHSAYAAPGYEKSMPR